MKDLKEGLDPVTYHDIVRQIFLNLDLTSLKSSRQVCREWDRLVMGEVWGSGEGRRKVELRPVGQWAASRPLILKNLQFHVTRTPNQTGENGFAGGD